VLAMVRLVRFGAEAALAARYGRRIIQWMDSPVFEMVVGAFAVLAIVGTAISAVAAFRSSRKREGTKKNEGREVDHEAQAKTKSPG
jgi:hypothetical protein